MAECVGEQVEHATFLTCGTGMALPAHWGIDNCEPVDVKTSEGTILYINSFN